jgi:multidrug resistance efflux pump
MGRSLLWFIVLGSFTFALAACGGAAQPTDAPAPDATGAAVAPVRADSRISVEGVVVPVQQAKLSLTTGGVVDEVLVAEGDAVTAGQLLLRIQSQKQAAAVAQAEAALAGAQARVAELKAGPRPQEIEAAQAAVAAAQAGLDKLQAGATAEEIAAAQAGLAQAQASLAKTTEGPDENQRIAAEAALANAEAARRVAQAAYDRVKGLADVGLRPESLQLEQATNAYNQALASLKALDDTGTAADIAGARAGVQRAQAQLDALRASARPADLAAAQAEMQRAEAQLALIEAGAKPELIAAAEAEVAAAQAALDQAKASLADTELYAPFAGTVARLDVNPGEQANPSTPLVWLADQSAWLVETTDLTELDVAKVQVGDTALLEFDALPDLELNGRVVRIRPLGEDRLGDITYQVVIEPERFEPSLRWNMTTAVTFEE